VERSPTFEPIGEVRSPLTDAETAPNQGVGTSIVAEVVVRPELRDGLLGLERYPYLWLVCWFDRQPAFTADDLRLVPQATIATGEVQGVFASRSPRRPNPIGLSLVRLLGVADGVLTVEGVDLLDGTPVLDIKPWFADADVPPG
jgi:tRNA-Thr(GGU) m(6)t(6)A37 methyltransferase TsaA